ncbi:hypothetical protein [Companilactobacillus ginsenosidimutans]|uniref:Uncharacterized protein n=1 Tax=Companilactobacillus ginsenosidimutans TaxID=1007676 RepID=A0A0H4QI63_9LACO|nr:hypothetical protein [Companilactobacillus ginsenosidimutans]AKP66731.1 hypothetical protein ABM34_03560 [Companilactobacillus ginsenosidimutans]
MEIANLVVLIILTVVVMSGTILIPIPLYRLLKYVKQSNRPFFTITKTLDGKLAIQNTGKTESKIVDIFLSPESKYFEALNDISFAPGQAINIAIPNEEKQSKSLEIKYFDTRNQKLYDQKFSLQNL